MDIVTQLVDIYYNVLDNQSALTELEANRYYSRMLAHNRIHIYTEGNEVVGLLESWRLDYEQLGRVVCWTDFSAVTENVTEGPVVYISDMWVKEDRRGSNISKILIDMFMESNKDADYYVSRRNKLKVKYYRVYDKETGYKNRKLAI